MHAIDFVGRLLHEKAFGRNCDHRICFVTQVGSHIHGLMKPGNAFDDVLSFSFSCLYCIVQFHA